MDRREGQSCKKTLGMLETKYVVFAMLLVAAAQFLPHIVIGTINLINKMKRKKGD